MGRLVSECVERKENLFTIGEEIRKGISPFFAGDEYSKAVSLELSTDKKSSYGGTSRTRQLEQLELAKQSINSIQRNTK